MSSLKDGASRDMTLADRRELDERITVTSAMLEGLKRTRASVVAGAILSGEEEILDQAMADRTGHTVEEIRSWRGQQRRIDESFSQRLADEASEPQREYSDCY